MKKDALQKLRVGIDATDKKLVALLAQRFVLTKKVGQYKATHNLPPKDPARELQVYEDRKAWAKKSGVDEALVEKLFALIMNTVKRNHKRLS